MLKRRTLPLVMMILTMFAPLAMGQERDFGELEMPSVEAREAGIGHIRLVRHGPEANQAEWVLNVDVYDLKGSLSGAVELRYPDPDVVEVKFAPVDSDATYRIRSDEAARTVRIEHVGVETVTFRPLCDPTELSERGKLGYTAEELAELHERQLECSKQIEVTGTSKSWQEAGEQYEEIVAYLITVNSRVRKFFGIPTKGQREAREELERVRREAERIRSQLEQEQESPDEMSGLQGLPQGFIRCPPEEDPYCPVGNNNFAVLGEGSCWFCSKSECCTEASEFADVDCILRSLSGCCANSLCKVTSGSDCGPFSWCACQVIGYIWDCRHCV